MLVTCQDIPPHGVECGYLSQNGLRVLTFNVLKLANKKQEFL
jgi:hypothetical protein